MRGRKRKAEERPIESDTFPFEFLSQVGERESWRKEIHRPVYHIHKWWAKRLGSVFRGILIGCIPGDGDLKDSFYRRHAFHGITVFDPFLGSGTTVGEAHKLGFIALGRDINPVAVDAVRVALGPLERSRLEVAFKELARGVGGKIRTLYRSEDSQGRECDVLYHFWVMQADCPCCQWPVDLFPTYVIARNANPDRRPEIRIVCPCCGEIFAGVHGQKTAQCPRCAGRFDPRRGPATGQKAICPRCGRRFRILAAIGHRRPRFRHFAKLVLTQESRKEYLAADEADAKAYRECSALLSSEVKAGRAELPTLALREGYNTRQAMSYGFVSWQDFFNDRQLLALSWLLAAIKGLSDAHARDALLMLFSGVLEFNNLFASYKGEGTGAVRHMFAHHILKPERVPIEANVWGTPKSSGSFSSLFRGRLLRAVEYRLAPVEVNGREGKGVVCAEPFSGEIQPEWPVTDNFASRGIYLSCGDSADTGLPDGSIDLIVTDPPFFDNVHYSELADFFFAWQQLARGEGGRTTRNPAEVQDSDAGNFARKLQGVFRECHRILKDDSLLVFTYHHSRDEGWQALALAVLGAGFAVVNSHPVKGDLSVAAPKSQAKEPIQFDIILVCRKASGVKRDGRLFASEEAILSAREKIRRLQAAGFQLSRNDEKIVLYGQLLTEVMSASDAENIADRVERELAKLADDQIIRINPQ